MVEHGAYYGTMLMLDLLAFGAMNRFAGVASRAVFSELSEAMESGFLFTQQHSVEVAGMGKVIIEEGAEVAPRIGNIIKNDLALFKVPLQESFAQTIKNRLSNETGNKLVGGLGQGAEIILPKLSTFEQARNHALSLVGDMGNSSAAYYGRLEASKGFGKIIGRTSLDKKVRWYLDYDPIKGTHINVQDFRLGKGLNAKKYAIPFEGTEQTFESLLKHLNR